MGEFGKHLRYAINFGDVLIIISSAIVGVILYLMIAPAITGNGESIDELKEETSALVTQTEELIRLQESSNEFVERIATRLGAISNDRQE